MKKKTLLAITALTVFCMGGQSLTASAAPGNNFHVISGGNGNHILIGYGSDCNQSIQDIVTIIDSNAANSQENAAISDELINCANSLKGTVDEFSLKK